MFHLGIPEPGTDMYGNYVYNPPEEDFIAAEKPVIEEITLPSGSYYRMIKPWNYDKAENAEREYPLIISLHGSGGGSTFYMIGTNSEQMQDYPCFLIAPTAVSSWGGGDKWIRDEIENLIETYRIDENCIYVTGFSMGGSGSYRFANAWWDEQQRITTAIVRCAGNQGSHILRDAMAGKTSVWYNVGDQDLASNRVQAAEDAFVFYRDFPSNTEASETIVSDNLGGFNRETKILTLNNLHVFKKSVYAGMGHWTGPIYSDPDLLPWLFRQHLENRE